MQLGPRMTISEGVTTATPNAAPSPELSVASGHGFGTLPVFLAAISTILGAVMFLRFGYAVGHVGLLGALAVIVIGHLVTVPTALAIAEIATNRKVEGGGEYFIISRSFGTTIGSVIGVSLYLSQAISVAFYLIALAEAFRPLAPMLEDWSGYIFDPRWVSVPATVGLIALVLVRGADVGVKALYVVVAVLAVALVCFFLGGPITDHAPAQLPLMAHIDKPDSFFVVFAICFPAFTGMTAGVGLSGDLANPRRSIPMGTLLGTFVGMIVYVAIVLKLAASATPDLLAGDQLVMGRIAIWGPIIPIGLGCATLSSAIGSILVAPRTLQALGADSALPIERANGWLASGTGAVNEPRNATLVTGGLALVIVLLGDVDFVARLISMFFMVTYGALCAISFLEHFAARPSYRPSFRSRWYISLLGAGMCLFVMFQMDPVYALLAILSMAGLYRLTLRSQRSERDDLAAMFEGVMTQATRTMHIALQRRRGQQAGTEWRPSAIVVSRHTFDRRAPLQLLRWLCYRFGFGTWLHYIEGNLDAESYAHGEEVRAKLLTLAATQESSVYMDTIVSPSLTSALAQSLQVPGVSGLPNNTVVFEFSDHDGPEIRAEVVNGCLFAAPTRRSLLVLRHGDLHFGERRSIHLWLTWNDDQNANLMVLLSYILLGHPDWSHAEIRVFAALPAEEVAERRERFHLLMAEGRIPVSDKNIRFLAVDNIASFRELVARESADADLCVLGFDVQGLTERRAALFENHPSLKAVLFVHAPDEIRLE